MTPCNTERNEHIFDSYCKRCLKRNALDLQRKDRRQSEREVTFSELSAREMASLSVTDNYFTDAYVFSILGESVGVSDSDLAEALTALPADRREIVLMSYFFDMTDKEIAEHLNMARRTVAYKRTSTLKELKKYMEESEE
jgi:RNA polymerase sigma factor (sigma-70 family)